MKNLIKLTIASILAVGALSSQAFANHHKGKKHEKTEKTEKRTEENTPKSE